MVKIKTLFQRNYESDRLVRDEVTPGCEWVLSGEGAPTEKIDGTCCKISGGEFFRRREVKPDKPIPPGFIEEDFDSVTGKRFGWVPVGYDKSDKYHREAFNYSLLDGTYELIGPKVQGNPYGLDCHVLEKHGARILDTPGPRSFNEIDKYLKEAEIEGIVWHHRDGRMVKIKRRDFGYSWPIK